MEDLATYWILFVIIFLSLIFQVIGAGIIDVSGISITHKGSKVDTNFSGIHNQIKGVKILKVHTAPSTVSVGSTFNIEGLVFNNSTSPITFPNGTCNSPVSIDFSKNVMIESQGIALCTSPTKDITLKPLQWSSIVSTHNSGIAYRATSPGITNATISFNYKVETANGEFPISDNISRVYGFYIHSMPSAAPANHHLRGIKLLQVHTYPPIVANGNSFGIRAVVFNNSTSAITFPNGTCTQSVHVNFNKNVEESRDSLCSTSHQKSITLRPNEQSFIVSGISYKAISFGTTNATMVLSYGVQNSESVYNDSTSRSFVLDVRSQVNPQDSSLDNASHFHIKGIKLLHIHTYPPKVYVGNIFGLRATAFNNSTFTISLANGTCLSPLSIKFDKNVITENLTKHSACIDRQALLGPGAQTQVFSSNLSKSAYKAISAGVANATIIFKYEVLTPSGKSFINDSVSRTYSMEVQSQPSSSSPKK